MTIFERIASACRVLAGRGIPGPADDYWYRQGGVETQSGIDISEESSLQILTVFACVAKISKTVASLPVHVFLKKGARERQVVDHPLSDLLTGMGNPWATGMSVRETMLVNVLLWGNSYAEILRDSSGQLNGLVPIQSSRVTPKWNDDRTDLKFEIAQDSGQPITMSSSDILHIPAMTLNGIVGLSVVGLARESLGLSKAVTTFGAAFFGNGAIPGGFLEFPADIQLSEERQDHLVEKFNENFKGPTKAHRVGRLRDGVKFSQYQMPLADMQFLELRKFQRIEICSLFDVPPAMIQEHDPGKYSTTEQQSIAWARDSLLPWCIRFESVLNAKFLGGNLYLKHNLAGLMRGDMKAQSEFFASGRQWGYLSANDIRELLEMNPIPNGDEYLNPLNMLPAAPPSPMP